MKRLLLAVAALFAVALLGAGAALLHAFEEPYGDFGRPIVLDYTPGTTGDELAAELEQRGVIRSRWLFQLLRAWRPDAVLQAGEYEFAEPASVRNVFRKLAEGAVRLHPITIPEGLTRFEIAELIETAGFGSRRRFLALTEDPTPIHDLFPTAKTLEGCLFPETYLFPRSADESDLLAAMLQRFRQVFNSAMEGKTAATDPYPTLILASMVEKETAVDEERPLVSSVYHNRLRIGMPMQCDPTVIYGLTLEDRYRGMLYSDDLLKPNPYNTYLLGGLPPGPIANPGRASIEAALKPAKSKYVYFVARIDGRPEHTFSRSLPEHNRAVAAYRRTQR